MEDTRGAVAYPPRNVREKFGCTGYAELQRLYYQARESKGTHAMTRTEMETILSSLLPRESATCDVPSQGDWQRLETRFGCAFPYDFRCFIELMAEYQFPGEILNVSTGRTNGNDLIEVAYDLEESTAEWRAGMVPFFAIGNGDYFCLNSAECPQSPVYYFYADRGSFEIYSPRFEDWVRDLPEFLA